MPVPGRLFNRFHFSIPNFRPNPTSFASAGTTKQPQRTLVWDCNPNSALWDMDCAHWQPDFSQSFRLVRKSIGGTY